MGYIKANRVVRGIDWQWCMSFQNVNQCIDRFLSYKIKINYTDELIHVKELPNAKVLHKFLEG